MITQDEIKSNRLGFIEALRSGRYKQVKNGYRYDNGFCAAGLSHELLKDEVKQCGTAHEVMTAYDISVGDLHTVIRLNDSGKSFKYIADYLELMWGLVEDVNLNLNEKELVYA